MTCMQSGPRGGQTTNKENKGDQPSGGETTWTNTGATRSGLRPTTRHYGCPMMMKNFRKCTWSVTLRQVDDADVVREDRFRPEDLHQTIRAVHNPHVVGTRHNVRHTLVCRDIEHTECYHLLVITLNGFTQDNIWSLAII